MHVGLPLVTTGATHRHITHIIMHRHRVITVTKKGNNAS